MANDLGERLALAPASSRKEHHSAFPGGLVFHSLQVLGNAMRLTGAFGWKVPKESLILVCLFHDLGKVGDEKNDYYVVQTDAWRSKNLGEEYTYNKELQYMTVPDRSLYLCQKFGLQLSVEEFVAIKIHDGQYADENSVYKFKEPMLADVVHLADLIAAKQEKGMLPL